MLTHSFLMCNVSCVQSIQVCCPRKQLIECTHGHTISAIIWCSGGLSHYQHSLHLVSNPGDKMCGFHSVISASRFVVNRNILHHKLSIETISIQTLYFMTGQLVIIYSNLLKLKLCGILIISFHMLSFTCVFVSVHNISFS